VGVFLGGALVLLLLVLLIIFVFRRRRKHIRRGTSTVCRRQLPAFADMTLHSEITSFLPTSGSANGLRSFEFVRRLSAGGEVYRQPTAETDDMPPSYDSVVKTSDISAVRRRKDGSSASAAHRSQARLSLPPFSAASFPPVLRGHRRAESDVEEHVYEDPASLRRSTSDNGMQNSADHPAMDHLEVSDKENEGPSLSEVDDESASALLMALAATPSNAVSPAYPTPQLLSSLPYHPIASNSSLNATPISSSQPRVPRIRLGTSALYSRPADSRVPDWCQSKDLLFASSSQLQPFSPLSPVGFAELIEGISHGCRSPADELPFTHNPQNTAYTSQFEEGLRPLLSQGNWSRVYPADPEFEARSRPVYDHSISSGNFQNHCPSAVSYLPNDQSIVDDRITSTSSARSSSMESEHFDTSAVSPLFDDESVDNIAILSD